MKFLAIIPTRKNSKGIKNKNLKNLIKNHSFIGLYKLQKNQNVLIKFLYQQTQR